MGSVENPPAFPLTDPRQGEYGLCNEGMSLRDWLAEQALGYLGQRKDIMIRDANHIASIAYELADAMLLARARATQGEPG